MVAPTGILAILAPPEYGRSLEHFRASLNRENALGFFIAAVPGGKPFHAFPEPLWRGSGLAVTLFVDALGTAPDVPEAGRRFAPQLVFQHVQMAVPAAGDAERVVAAGDLAVGEDQTDLVAFRLENELDLARLAGRKLAFAEGVGQPARRLIGKQGEGAAVALFVGLLHAPRRHRFVGGIFAVLPAHLEFFARRGGHGA